MWYYYHFNPETVNDNTETYKFTPMKLHHRKRFFASEFPTQFPKESRKFLSLFLALDPEMRTFSTMRLQDKISNGFDWSTAAK